VRVSFVDTSYPFKQKSEVVYFIASGPERNWFAQAKSCTREYRGTAPSVYCFGFSSERAFQYAGVRRRPPAKMRRVCWSVYWGKPEERRGFGASTNPAAQANRCPDAAG
jgi:hypothetical protein